MISFINEFVERYELNCVQFDLKKSCLWKKNFGGGGREFWGGFGLKPPGVYRPELQGLKEASCNIQQSSNNIPCLSWSWHLCPVFETEGHSSHNDPPLGKSWSLNELPYFHYVSAGPATYKFKVLTCHLKMILDNSCTGHYIVDTDWQHLFLYQRTHIPLLQNPHANICRWRSLLGTVEVCQVVALP